MDDFIAVERDKIASMDRATLLQHICELEADGDVDDNDREIFHEYHMFGVPARNWHSNHQLREYAYELADVDHPYRLHPAGEVEPTRMTLGKLLLELSKLAATDQRIKDPSQFPVLMQHRLNDDVTIGARIVTIKIEGFHMRLDLIGPQEEKE